MKKIYQRVSIALILALIMTLTFPNINTSETESSAAVETDAVGLSPQNDDNGVFRFAIYEDRTTGKKSFSKSGYAYSKVEASPAASSNPYLDGEVDSLGTLLSDQLKATFGVSIGQRATISTVSSTELDNLNKAINSGLPENEKHNYRDISSKVSFSFPTSNLPKAVREASTNTAKAQQVLFYIEQAISRYPTLCCLFTLVNISASSADTTLTIYSPIEADQIKNETTEYENNLNEILKIPVSNRNMTDKDKLLYIHDEVVALGEYATGRGGAFSIDYAPIGVMNKNLGVCQSYAAVFNHAATKCGLTSYVVDSDTHAWNAVYIDGKWSYIDTTWDDTRSYGQEKDYVKHQYLFTDDKLDGDTSFQTRHTLTSEYAAHFPGLESSLNNDTSYYPRKAGITSQMGYLGGYFYFSENNTIKRWDRANNLYTFSQIPSASARRVSICDNLIYVSGSDGLYQSDASLSSLHTIANTSYTGMYEACSRLYVSTGGTFYIFHDASIIGTVPTPTSSLSPTTTSMPLIPDMTTIPSQAPTPTSSASPGTSASPSGSPGGIPTVPPSDTPTGDPTDASPSPAASSTPSFTAPPATKITKIKNNKKRAVYLKWKKSKGTSRYQVQYSTSSSFKTKQFQKPLTNSTTIVNLYKNKTYYFRVRAVKIKSFNKELYFKYSKWSPKKKIKVKK